MSNPGETKAQYQLVRPPSSACATFPPSRIFTLSNSKTSKSTTSYQALSATSGTSRKRCGHVALSDLYPPAADTFPLSLPNWTTLVSGEGLQPNLPRHRAHSIFGLETTRTAGTPQLHLGRTYPTASNGGLRFRHVDLDRSKPCALVLSEACAETLETLRLNMTGIALGE